MVAIYMWTGNPFVDAGISAILELSNKKEPQDIALEDVEKIARETLIPVFLTDTWKNNLHPIFPNHKATNTSIKDKKKALEEKIGEFIQQVAPIESKGNCIACGCRPSVQSMTKSYIPLTGSGSLRNYFSYAVEGADYCSTCAFAVQCLPLVLYSSGGKFLLIHSNSYKIMKYCAKECIKELNIQIASGNYTGCFNEKYTNPVNALFYRAGRLLQEHQEKWSDENVSMRVYHFTNYNQGPELDFYDLPANVFHFLANINMKDEYRKSWNKIVYRGYFFQKKGEKIPISIKEGEEEKYKNHQNQVYLDLLAGNSIVRFFFDVRQRSVHAKWEMLCFYLKEVLQMKEDRIQAIKQVADKIAQVIQASSNGRKRLGQLERATNYASFRAVLLRIIHDNLAQKQETPVFTFDQYMKHLFPEGAMNWKEVQDLLLFSLYETLHTWLLEESNVQEEDDSEDSVSDDSNN